MIKISPEVEKELVAFIKEKTGCGAFVLGMMDEQHPCKHLKEFGHCDRLHRFEAFACDIEKYAINRFIETIGKCLNDDLPKDADLIISPYESSTT